MHFIVYDWVSTMNRGNEIDVAMEDELLNEQQFVRLGEQRQELLLARHCTVIEDSIRRAASRSEAEKIADTACLKFNTMCSSSIVRGALHQYVQNIIGEHWDGR
jgi:hypothetical protein